MSSFSDAVARFVSVTVDAAKVALSQNKEACRAVAIGYLSKLTKTQINTQAKEALIAHMGQDSGSNAWKSAKVPLSQAWRAIGGEYGFGVALAEKWAAGDFTVSLAQAYEASASPAKETDNVARCVKLLVNMTPEQRDNVATQVADILSKQDAAEAKRNANAAKFGLTLVTETQEVA